MAGEDPARCSGDGLRTRFSLSRRLRDCCRVRRGCRGFALATAVATTSHDNFDARAVTVRCIECCNSEACKKIAGKNMRDSRASSFMSTSWPALCHFHCHEIRWFMRPSHGTNRMSFPPTPDKCCHATGTCERVASETHDRRRQGLAVDLRFPCRG